MPLLRSTSTASAPAAPRFIQYRLNPGDISGDLISGDLLWIDLLRQILRTLIQVAHPLELCRFGGNEKIIIFRKKPVAPVPLPASAQNAPRSRRYLEVHPQFEPQIGFKRAEIGLDEVLVFEQMHIFTQVHEVENGICRGAHLLIGLTTNHKIYESPSHALDRCLFCR